MNYDEACTHFAECDRKRAMTAADIFLPISAPLKSKRNWILLQFQVDTFQKYFCVIDNVHVTYIFH